MIEAARKYKRMVQVGSQSRSTPHKIEAIAKLQDGVIGKLYQSKGICYKRRVSIGHKPDEPTPPGLNWDLFLGPPRCVRQRAAIQVQLALVLGHRQWRYRQPGRS